MRSEKTQETGLEPGLSPVASNVVRLRTDRGFTQKELATKAGISRVALGRIEKGEVSPRAETLGLIAKALKADVAELVTPAMPLHGVRFRAAKRVNSREQILAEVSRWLRSYRWLELELGETEPFALHSLVGGGHTPEEMALQARAKLPLQRPEAIRDICGLLEDNGVKVLLVQKMTDAFFGLSVAPGEFGPAVVVNTWDRISVERWIFTAAHELGHLLLHREAYNGHVAEQPEAEEREADRFASHFLMPEAGFEAEWEQTRGLPLLWRVLKVKRMFRVSYKTVLYRLVETEREPVDAWRQFQLQHKQRFGTTLRKIEEPARLAEGEFRLDWNRAGEPDGLSKSDFVQDRLSRLVRKALEKHVISLSRAAEILQISRDEMRDLSTSWGR